MVKKFALPPVGQKIDSHVINIGEGYRQFIERNIALTKVGEIFHEETLTKPFTSLFVIY